MYCESSSNILTHWISYCVMLCMILLFIYFSSTDGIPSIISEQASGVWSLSWKPVCHQDFCFTYIFIYCSLNALDLPVLHVATMSYSHDTAYHMSGLLLLIAFYICHRFAIPYNNFAYARESATMAFITLWICPCFALHDYNIVYVIVYLIN